MTDGRKDTPAATVPTDDGEETPASLDRPYLYQNPRTGQPSPAPLTARQLCKILCPPGGGRGGDDAKRSSAAAVHADTLVLGYDPRTNAYDGGGWKAARMVPILREACAAWHYESASGAVEGPLSTRDLAGRLVTASAGEGGVVGESTRVWSASIAKGDHVDGQEQEQEQQWRPLLELPHLRLALEAFRESEPPPWAADEKGAAGAEAGAKSVDAPRSTSSERHPHFDAATMTFVEDGGETSGAGGSGSSRLDAMSTASTAGSARDALEKRAAEELEAFLSLTADVGKGVASHRAESDEEEEYESDGGTPYVKDPRTGNWIHAALAPPRPNKAKDRSGGTFDERALGGGAADNGGGGDASGKNKKKRKKKAKFAARNSKCWIYVAGLPPDTDEEEVAAFFQKVGILDLDPNTQHPKVKLYRHKTGDGGSISPGSLKGDASVCYARPESVDLALQILDEAMFRPTSDSPLSVQRAKFEQHGDKFEERKDRVSNAKRKVARLAALQAVGWDEGENGRITGGLKGLRIIVLKGMFHTADFANDGDEQKKEDAVLRELEREVHADCGTFGDVEKITVFSKNPAGVVVVKFAQPTAASDAVAAYNGRVRKKRKIEASFWDGVTDFTVHDEEKEEKETEKRLDEFGSWLESQEVPEEFRLQVEEDDEEEAD